MGFFSQLKGDLVFLRGVLRALRMTTHIARNPNRIFPNVIEELAARHGDAPALLSPRETFSYRQLFDRSNRYSRWARGETIGKGDTICLLMPNRPEFMAVWLGITRVGGVTALLNTNLIGHSLAHCIDIVSPKHIVVAAEMMGQFESIRPLLKSAPKLWVHGDAAGRERIDHAVERLSGEPLAASERPALTIEDPALYIYTSGTTGLPKAANVNHYRVMLACFGFAGVMGTKTSDRNYVCLPMYHTAGGLCAIGSLLVAGGSVYIRERFSVREFWDDIVNNDCTMMQYIGELCRYLVNAPPNPNETKHKLRLACGNGLRPDIWDEFKARFRIPLILEFYAATEGNVLMFNFEGKTGAVGRLPWFLEHRFPTALVKFDVETGEPLRNAEGFCIPCAPNEAGEAIGKIVNDANKPGNRFEGYARAEDTEKKILRHVFAPNDIWFRTGDLMRKDENGYFYFVDRIGDTFRWKGENVSTSEVAEAINRFPGIQDTNVYGVTVPGREGRAGMAAIVCDDCDLAALARHLQDSLPDYARPVFLRIRKDLDMTATFKQRKIDLVKQGYDPDIIGDPLYFFDPAVKAFVLLDRALYRDIQSGRARV
ncbi:long-chain-acyl-CoA synthetase [Pseudorhodoplanes sp.]|uniref:long-chain-acyl-CoA synthetase n=1 Tax=Pseudorhodoplanes sp. TaxID=1934341 RepID=UPI00391D651D